jgi:2-polyprenyl-6-methoxyphenol hydroxylase-like FAD-dependent oxidoreductase
MSDTSGKEGNAMIAAARQPHVDVDVAIAGAGPTGLLLAAELAMRGVSVVVLERNVARPGFVRAFNLNARSLEILDRRGIVDRFLAEGPKVPFTHFAALSEPLQLAELDTDHPYVLGIPQTRTEALLEAHALEQGGEIWWGHMIADVAQDEDGVTMQMEVVAGDASSAGASRTLRAAWLVGCDGGRSTVRKRAGIGFPGTAATRWALLGDVELADPASLSFGNHQTSRGSVFVIPRPGYVRVITCELTPPASAESPVTLVDLSDAVAHVLGRDVQLVRPRWLTRFSDAARLAERYRAGRVLLAGDAAHVHPPAGAQGLNVGLQDAFNLGWKLAAVVRDAAPDELLDSYHDERHAAGERLLTQTRAQAELGQTDDRLAPVRGLLRDLARDRGVSRLLAEMVTGLDTRYAVAPPEELARQPMLGRLAPNIALEVAGRRTSLAACLRGGRALLVTGAAHSGLAEVAVPLRDRLEVATIPGASEQQNWLRGANGALVRPDGHIAWMAHEGDDDVASLRASAERWLGVSPRAAKPTA